MPITDGLYVNPGWKDGAPPALSAAEMNAISDTLAAAQNKNVSQDSLIAALQNAVSALQNGGAKIEVGSYVGTGTYGADNPCSITCSFVPKLVWIYGYKTKISATNYFLDTSYSGFRVPMGLLDTSYERLPPYGFVSAAYADGYSKKSNDGKTLTWYNLGSASAQINQGGNEFYWVAFG